MDQEKQEKNIYDCAIVVPSCDGYEDSWLPFFSFFFKYWPDCPFPVYLITGKKIYPDPRVETIALGVDDGWANNMKASLEQIPEKYFLYFLEDVFLTKKVDTKRILALLELTKKDHVSCLRLYPSPAPTKPYLPNRNLGVIDQRASYRVSTMTAIWDKEVFIRLLKPGENAWQMEFEGTKRSWLSEDLFLSVWSESPAIEYFATAIKKGKWQYDAVLLCKKEGVLVDLTHRPVETKGKYLKRRLERVPILGWCLKLADRLKNFTKRVG